MFVSVVRVGRFFRRATCGRARALPCKCVKRATVERATAAVVLRVSFRIALHPTRAVLAGQCSFSGLSLGAEQRRAERERGTARANRGAAENAAALLVVWVYLCCGIFFLLSFPQSRYARKSEIQGEGVRTQEEILCVRVCVSVRTRAF